MTTLTVEINKDKDLSALIDFIGQLGLNYHLDLEEQLVYTDEIKRELDRRYSECQNGAVEMVSAEESKSRIQDLLASK